MHVSTIILLLSYLFLLLEQDHTHPETTPTRISIRTAANVPSPPSAIQVTVSVFCCSSIASSVSAMFSVQLVTGRHSVLLTSALGHVQSHTGSVKHGSGSRSVVVVSHCVVISCVPSGRLSVAVAKND